VLLADDDDGIREVLAEMLGLDGPHRVVSVCDGKEALDYLKSGAPLPGVIVTDLMMPVMSGWELLEAVQTAPELAAIPVVAVSASAAGRRDLGGAYFMPKPIRPEELANLVEALCEACQSDDVTEEPQSQTA
jgi:CheY-like chemotaxis protein